MVPVRQLAGQERGEVVGEAEEAEKGSQQGIVDGQAAAVEEQGIVLLCHIMSCVRGAMWLSTLFYKGILR